MYFFNTINVLYLVDYLSPFHYILSFFSIWQLVVAVSFIQLLFPFCFRSQSLLLNRNCSCHYHFCICSIFSICPSHLNICAITTLTMLTSLYRLFISSFVLLSLPSSILLRPEVFLNIFLSHTSSFVCFALFEVHVSQAYGTTSLTTALYSLIIVCLKIILFFQILCSSSTHLFADIILASISSYVFGCMAKYVSIFKNLSFHIILPSIPSIQFFPH